MKKCLFILMLSMFTRPLSAATTDGSLGFAPEINPMVTTDIEKQFNPTNIDERLDAIVTYLDLQCLNKPKSAGPEYYDGCLLKDLIVQYQAEVTILKSIIGKQYELPHNWTANHLIAGFWNELWAADATGLSIKPFFNFLILRIAIYSELGNLESFIAKQKTRQTFAAKRTVLPQLKAYFGGFYFLSRIMNYEKTLQCNFYEDCKNGACQVEAKKECLNEKATLRAVADKLLQEYSTSIQSLDNDFKTVMNSDEYAEATPVSAAYMMGRDFYTLYQKQDIAHAANEFVGINKNCSEIASKSALQLSLLCQKIESLVQIPKDVNDKSMKDAVAAALAFAEFFNAKGSGSEISAQPESGRYLEIDTYLRRQTNDFMQSIMSFFSFYTPRNLENP